MKAIAIISLLFLNSIQSWADEIPRAASAAALAKRTPDLDFSDDDDTDLPAHPVKKGASNPSPLLYWGLGFTVAAGGLIFYLFKETESAPTTTKSTQYFTDVPN
jgi:hypothetical protein